MSPLQPAMGMVGRNERLHLSVCTCPFCGVRRRCLASRAEWDGVPTSNRIPAKALLFTLHACLLSHHPLNLSRDNMPITLHYFPVRGRGEPVRLMLQDAGSVPRAASFRRVNTLWPVLARKRDDS